MYKVMKIAHNMKMNHINHKKRGKERLLNWLIHHRLKKKIYYKQMKIINQHPDFGRDLNVYNQMLISNSLQWIK